MNFFFWWSLPFTTFDPHNKNSPKKTHAISTTPTYPPSPKTSQGETWTQSPLLSKLISSESPHTRFTDHHKQDFPLLALTSNYKVIKFSSQISLRLWIPNTPHMVLPKHILHFKQLAEDPKRLYPSLRPHKKILNPPCLFVPLINIRIQVQIYILPSEERILDH